MTITIVLADDHQIFRDSLRCLLERHEDFQIVGEAADGQQAVNLVDRLQPKVVVLDLAMPGLNGLEALQKIKGQFPEVLVVVLSAHEEEKFVVDAFRFGADAYIVKEQSVADLVHAVRTVVAGERYVSPRHTAPPANTSPALSGPAVQMPDASYASLTLRERQVLGLTAQGYSNAQIGERLNISARTVETHRAHLMLKLGLKSRADLMRYAQKRQLGQ